MQSVLPSGRAWDLAIPRSPDWAFWLGSTADVALQSPARTGSRETAKAAWEISRFWQFASLEIRCQIGNGKFMCVYDIRRCKSHESDAGQLMFQVHPVYDIGWSPARSGNLRSEIMTLFDYSDPTSP
jgi:hypothetical protein